MSIQHEAVRSEAIFLTEGRQLRLVVDIVEKEVDGANKKFVLWVGKTGKNDFPWKNIAAPFERHITLDSPSPIDKFCKDCSAIVSPEEFKNFHNVPLGEALAEARKLFPELLRTE